MRRPHLVFVGHPRSGSGLINGWLDAHPDIWMAQKELHYFGRDLDYNRPPRTLDNYLRRFADAGDQQVIGEASTWLLTSKTAAREIHDFRPDMKIVASIRNPIDWLHSLHGHLVFSGNEDIEDFDAALAAEPERTQGRGVPPLCAPPFAVLYTSLVRYADQLGRFFDVFGRERVHVVVLDDVKADAAGAYRDLLRFLEVRERFDGFDAAVAGDKRSRNSHRTVRSRRIRRFIKQPAQQEVLRRLRDDVPAWELVLRAVRRANIKLEAGRDRMAPATRARLAAQLLPEVERVSALLDRDLTGWCAPR